MNLHTLPFVINDSGSENSESLLNENVKALELNNISDALVTELKNELEVFSQSNAVLKNILISTADGFEIASLLTPGSELHIRKISALTSSLLGISSAMLQEMGGGEQNAVFMESNNNMILFNRIPAEQKMLCLMAVTTKDESIGQIFWRLRQLSEDVIKICNKHI
ncbi:roadblock/LC7 domain-containing protein [Klebsiella spallanzanii]|uniref:roadblock/LC7 domain-containing protein n=1 Tax=Klebsiella spallanzanii TaxID=2587528 RepID=UPI001157C36A|nr:hypothetical protein [Klebsiella spallanzanii]VUS64841.1 hypothetical protein SB6419_03897 [Klebsiella spallanzanii]